MCITRLTMRLNFLNNYGLLTRQYMNMFLSVCCMFAAWGMSSVQRIQNMQFHHVMYLTHTTIGIDWFRDTSGTLQIYDDTHLWGVSIHADRCLTWASSERFLFIKKQNNPSRSPLNSPTHLSKWRRESSSGLQLHCTPTLYAVSVDVALLSLYSVNSVWEEGVIRYINHKKKTHLNHKNTSAHNSDSLQCSAKTRTNLSRAQQFRKAQHKEQNSVNSNYLQWLQWLLIMHHCISKLNETCPKQAINKYGNSTPVYFTRYI